MIRGFLIFAIVSYILYVIGKFFFNTLRSFGEGRDGNQMNTGRSGKFKPSDGNVEVNKKPENPESKKGFKGGEYIDYEEV